MPITIYIRNMVCNRCIRVVKEELEKINIEITAIQLGEATIATENINWEQLKKVLEENGFGLLEDKKAQLVETIKALIIKLIHQSDNEKLTINYSDYIAQTIGKDYHYLSTLFSTLENVTIEKYIILQKIERVKELLIYNELTLSEIAYQINYSSVAHLSNQFKQVTGFSPSEYKKLKSHHRKELDKLLE